MTSKVYGNPTRKPVLNSKRSVKRRKKKFHAGGTVQSSPQPKASPLSGFQVEATKDMPTPVGTMLAPDQVAEMPDIGVAPVATPTLPKQMQQQQQMQQQMQQQLATQNQQQMQQLMAHAQQQQQQQQQGKPFPPWASSAIANAQQQMQQGKPTFTGGPSPYPMPKGMLDTLRQRQKDQLLTQLDDAMKNNQTSQVDKILGQIRNIGSPVKNPRRNPRIRYNPKKVQQIRKRQSPKKRRGNTRRLRRLLTNYN